MFHPIGERVSILVGSSNGCSRLATADPVSVPMGAAVAHMHTLFSHVSQCGWLALPTSHAARLSAVMHGRVGIFTFKWLFRAVHVSCDHSSPWGFTVQDFNRGMLYPACFHMGLIIIYTALFSACFFLSSYIH